MYHKKNFFFLKIKVVEGGKGEKQKYRNIIQKDIFFFFFFIIEFIIEQDIN